MQRNAMAVWEADAKGETGPSFIERISAETEVQARIPPEKLKELVSLDRHLEHIDEAYRRVGLEG